MFQRIRTRLRGVRMIREAIDSYPGGVCIAASDGRPILANRTINERLFMSANTVKYHVKNIMQKTGYHSTVQLIADVVEKRLILPKY